MPKLEEITEIRGKFVLLKNIENFILKRILSSRLKEDKFNFYKDAAHRDSPDKHYKDTHEDNHKDGHKDNYKDSEHNEHNDYKRHSDSHPSSDDYPGGYCDTHEDTGHNETINLGYSEHSDSKGYSEWSRS